MMTEESSFIVQGSVAGTMAIFLQKAVLRMIPYSIPALALLALDLVYGIRAASYRGEKVRFSTAMRKSITKFFSYVCWLILASTMALAFNQNWIEWLVLGGVYLNELASVIGNYLEPKGLEISWKAVWGAILKIGGQKVGVDTDGIDPTEFLKPVEKQPQPRDSKGRFVKRGTGR